MKGIGNISKVESREKGRKDFHNRTIRFWNKYVNDVRVLTFSVIVTSFLSSDIKESSSSIIVVAVRTVLLGMSRLSLSTQWTDVQVTVPFDV